MKKIILLFIVIMLENICIKTGSEGPFSASDRRFFNCPGLSSSSDEECPSSTEQSPLISKAKLRENAFQKKGNEKWFGHSPYGNRSLCNKKRPNVFLRLALLCSCSQRK